MLQCRVRRTCFRPESVYAMIWLFASALLFGGVLIGLSVFGGHSDGSHDALSDHLVADAGLMAVFSLRNLTWASVAFGGIGVLAVVTARSTTTTLLSSIGAGLVTLLGVHLLFTALRRSESSLEALDALAIGVDATLVLPFNADGLGMISFRAQGQLHEMPARRADNVATMPSDRFTACRIGWIENGIAVVQPLE
jgi:hypothetical protein